MDDWELEQRARLAVFFEDRRVSVVLTDAVLKALVAGERNGDGIARAVAERLYNEGFDSKGLDIRVIALELSRRLQRAGIVRIGMSPPKRKILVLESNALVFLTIPRAVASNLTLPFLSRMAEESGDLFRALEKRFSRREYGADDASDMGVPSSSAGQMYSATPDAPSGPSARAEVEGSVSEAEANYKLHEVFFATCREPRGDDNFGGSRSDTLCFGRCAVSVPVIRHKIGKVERPFSLGVWQFKEDKKKHIVLQRVDRLGESEFYDAVRDSSEQTAFVFVHGFNVNFRDAVRRTAQLKHDLEFKGAAVLFSWPSKAVWSLTAYTADEATVQWVQPRLEAFLIELAQRTGFRTIHVIAHSMGSRPLAHSLERIAVRRSAPRFRNIVLAAPDIDRDTFIDLADALASTADSVTLYASSKDKALNFSRRIHEAERAGECSNIVVVPSITTIDVSLLNTNFLGLGHGYVTSSRTVLNDLHAIIAGQMPPRFGLRWVVAGLHGYWKFAR